MAIKFTCDVAQALKIMPIPHVGISGNYLIVKYVCDMINTQRCSLKDVTFIKNM
jgi:hypothetical protein